MSKYEKLIDTSNRDVAGLCFPNKCKLSVAEIMETFSEYGVVVAINCAGDEAGFRFVRFRTKEEALNCAIGLDGNPKIRLQPIKSKARDSNEYSQHQFAKNKQGSLNNKKNDRISCNAEQIERADSTKSSQSSRKSKTNGNQKANRDDNFNSINYANGDSSGESINDQQYATNDQDSIMNQLTSRLARNFPRTGELSNDRIESQNSKNSLNAAKLAQLQKFRGTTANTFQPLNSNSIHNLPQASTALMSSQVSASPSSSHDSNGEESTSDMPPPLIYSFPSLPSSQVDDPKEEIKVLPASDVVLANIHSNLGISNIYHMLRKFSPIHISDIETVSGTNIRLCFVYFDSPKNALEVEQLFDGASVCGQNLIALRPHRLTLESGIF